MKKREKITEKKQTYIELHDNVIFQKFNDKGLKIVMKEIKMYLES